MYAKYRTDIVRISYGYPNIVRMSYEFRTKPMDMGEQVHVLGSWDWYFFFLNRNMCTKLREFQTNIVQI